MAKKCLNVRRAKKCVRVDSDVLDRASQFSWHMHQGYPATTVGSGADAHKLYLHRFVVDAPKGSVVDHINGDPLDNRRANLRVATKSQNAANTSRLATNKSGFKGVVKRRNRFRALIHQGGKTIGIGTFKTPEKAACAYDREAKKRFGEYARLNGLKCSD